MKKLVKLLTLSLLCASLFVGCEKSNGGNGKIKVAGLIRNDKETFLQSYTQALRDAALAEGVDLEVYVCNDDAAIQIDQLKIMLTQGVKCFVITPVETGITEQITKLVNSMGGAVAFSNILPSDQALDVGKNFFYASSAEISAGDYQAEILDGYFKNNPSKISGKNVNIIYLNGEYGHTAQIFRKQGFLEGMESRGYTVNILGEDGANWGFDSARQQVLNMLPTIGGRINAIVAQNDDMALGAVAALEDSGYVNAGGQDSDGDGTIISVPVLGVDATTSAKQSVKENKLYATVLQDSNGQASTALELVLECYKNGGAKNFVTKKGVGAAKKVTGEAPLTRTSVMDQIYLVPFVPVTE